MTDAIPVGMWFPSIAVRGENDWENVFDLENRAPTLYGVDLCGGEYTAAEEGMHREKLIDNIPILRNKFWQAIFRRVREDGRERMG